MLTFRSRRMGKNRSIASVHAISCTEHDPAPLPVAERIGLAGTVTLGATATDDVGVTAVEFQIDGVAIGAADTTAPYETTLDTSAYPTGQHVVRARASDATGNVSPWSSATVRFGGAVTQPAGFTRNESWISGLANATAFAQAPDGR